MLKKMKLAPKIAIILCVLLFIIFSIFIFVSVTTLQSSVQKSTFNELEAIASANSYQIQNVLSKAENVTYDIKYYIEQTLKGKDTQNNTMEAKSDIYKDLKLNGWQKKIEDYILSTTAYSVSNIDEITAIGVLFSPYAFSDTKESYSPYISITNSKINIGNVGEYSEYSKESYWSDSFDSKKSIFTKPYDFTLNGELIKMITTSIPIIVNGDAIGVVLCDVNIEYFNQVNSKSQDYPSMSTSIVMNDGTYIFDSVDKQNVGKNISESFIDKNDSIEANDGFAKGNTFHMEGKNLDNKKTYSFFHPLLAGDLNWYSLSNITSSDVNQNATKTTILLLIMTIVALFIIAFSIIVVLKKTLKPIEKCADRLKLLAAGDLHTEVFIVDSEDETGILAKSTESLVEGIKNIINDLIWALTEMADGNFNITTKIKYMGDFEPLKKSISDIIYSLSNTLSQINYSSDQVASGSEQMSSASQALAEGATDQASSVEELFATITEISEQIKNNAESASKARKMTDSNAKQMTVGNDKMTQMIKAMGDISQASTQIGAIIKTIEDIATQTNLLALNAAIEAARVGEAGEGFAIIANKVRELAIKSAESAKDTTTLIKNTVDLVENGSKIADDTANSLLSIVESSERVTKLVDQIAEASNAQTFSIGQVTQGVEQISTVVQTNSATAQESAASSQELSGQAQTLKSMVSRFKIKKYTNSDI